MGKKETCNHSGEFSELMSLALDSLLGTADEQRLHDHLAACAACQAEWEAMQQVAALFEPAEMIGPPLGFAIRIERQLAEQSKKRRRTFGGLAVLTGSLSLAGVTITALALIIVGLLAWISPGSAPTVQQGSSAVSNIASGLGLMGKGAALFLKDLLLRYGPPLLLLVGVGLAFLAGVWTWLYLRRPGRSHHNGIA